MFLKFPVGRTRTQLRKRQCVSRINAGAAIYLAATLEHLTIDVLQLAGEVARDTSRIRIVPRHLRLAIHSDNEFSKLFNGVIIEACGVPPHISSMLLPMVKITTKKQLLANTIGTDVT